MVYLWSKLQRSLVLGYDLLNGAKQIFLVQSTNRFTIPIVIHNYHHFCYFNYLSCYWVTMEIRRLYLHIFTLTKLQEKLFL